MPLSSTYTYSSCVFIPLFHRTGTFSENQLRYHTIFAILTNELENCNENEQYDHRIPTIFSFHLPTLELTNVQRIL